MKCNQVKFSVAVAVSAAIASLTAAPKATVTSVVQDPATRVVTVGYSLNEPAIVTMAFKTNGVVVADRNVRSVAGSVNRYVPAAGAYVVKWFPGADGLDLGTVTASSIEVTAWPKSSPPMYVSVDLSITNGDDHIRFYASESTLPYSVTNECWKIDRLLMRRVYAAGREWRMGSPTQEINRVSSAGCKETAHPVVLSEDYYLGVYELTRRQYAYIVNGALTVTNSVTQDCRTHPQGDLSPNAFRGDMSDNAAYDWPTKGHAVDPTKPLGKLRVLAGNHFDFDLPTEAQWEYAARAEMGTRFATDDESKMSITNVAWTSVSGNASSPAHCGEGGWAHPVGELRPNAWGFYDMLGNVGEWCLDWAGDGADGSLEVDPQGPATGTVRIARGGGWHWDQTYARCASRNGWWAPSTGRGNHGFRLCAPAVYK